MITGSLRVRTRLDRMTQRCITRRTARHVDDGVDTLPYEELARAHAAAARVAHDVHRHRTAEDVEILGHRGERNVHGTGYVTLFVFVRFANVDDDRSPFEQGVQFTGGNFSDHHGASPYRLGDEIGSMFRSLTLTTASVSISISKRSNVATAR